MFAANTYLIRPAADDDDATSLSRLAEFDSDELLSTRVLIGQIDGVPAAAISLVDGRVIADPVRCTGHLLACLRVRADALRAYEATPSLPRRLLAGLATTRCASPEPHPEHDSKQDRAGRVRVADPRTRTRRPRQRFIPANQ